LRRIVLRRLLRESADLVIGKVLLHSRERSEHQVAGMRGELLAEALHVGALLPGARDAGQRARGIAREHAFDDVADRGSVESAERLRCLAVADLPGGGIMSGEELVE